MFALDLTRGHGERGKDGDVEVAVVLALDVLDERVDVVGLRHRGDSLVLTPPTSKRLVIVSPSN